MTDEDILRRMGANLLWVSEAMSVLQHGSADPAQRDRQIAKGWEAIRALQEDIMTLANAPESNHA